MVRDPKDKGPTPEQDEASTDSLEHIWTTHTSEAASAHMLLRDGLHELAKSHFSPAAQARFVAFLKSHTPTQQELRDIAEKIRAMRPRANHHLGVLRRYFKDLIADPAESTADAGLSDQLTRLRAVGCAVDSPAIHPLAVDDDVKDH